MFGREKFVVCTKHIPGGLLGQKCESKDDLRAVIKTACNNSLKELGIETIDLYYLHRLYPKFQIEDVMGVFKELKEEGKISVLAVNIQNDQPYCIILHVSKLLSISKAHEGCFIS